MRRFHVLIVGSAFGTALWSIGCSPSSAAAPPVVAPQPPSPAPPPAPSVTYLHGELELPGNTTLAYAVELTVDPDAEPGYRGKIYIPAQNVSGMPLEAVNYQPDQHLRFSLPVPGTPTWTAQLDATGSVDCSFTQGPVHAPCTMKRTATLELPPLTPPRRPQTPSAPFAYDEREVAYRHEAAGITITGTLTLPAGQGPHPAVLLISGSGPQDRNGTIAGHQPFWVLADYLTVAGIAVLRVDDRGVGGTGAGSPGATTTDLAGDVVAGLEFLTQQPELDAQRLGLIGHSEGGAIAPMVAARDPRVRFVVMMAGPGVDGRALLAMQTQRLAETSGMTSTQAKQQRDQHLAMTQIIVEQPDPAVRRTKLRAFLRQSATQTGGSVPTEAELDQTVQSLEDPWVRHFLALDPSDYLRHVQCPVLALNGTLDIQVDADQNLPAIEAALTRGGRTSVTTRRLESLNHLFQAAETGAIAEYATIEQTIDPLVLDLIASWILDVVSSA